MPAHQSPLPSYVSLVLGFEVTLENGAPLKTELAELGFKSFLGDMRAKVESWEELAALFLRLNALGVAFSAGKEWCPSEVVEELKDRGLLQGDFTQIYWTGPGDWHLRKI
jgi:hypothetical protein